jgi:hypothetical protein
MKIELVDNHSKSLVVSIVWIFLALLWCYIMDIYSRPISLLLALLVLLWFPVLLLKQYFFGSHLRIGINERVLYFPLHDKTLKKIPIRDIKYLSLEKLSYENTNNTFGEQSEEVIVIKLNEQVEERIVSTEKHLWGDYYFNDNSVIYLGYTDRKKTVDFISKINKIVKTANQKYNAIM